MAAGLFTGLFDLGREGFLGGEIDWDTANIRAGLVRNWTPDKATNKFVSEVTGTIAANVLLTGKTITGGVANCTSPITWTTVASNASAHYIIIYQSSAVGGGSDVAASAQRLIAFLDSNGANGLPVTPNGNDISWTPDTGANKLFKL